MTNPETPKPFVALRQARTAVFEDTFEREVVVDGPAAPPVATPRSKLSRSVTA